MRSVCWFRWRKWREKEAQARDVPRRRVLKDDAIYDIANQQPANEEALSKLRTIPRGFERSRDGKAILEAVADGLARNPDSLPSIRRGEPLPDHVAPMADLMKVWLKQVSKAEGVASRLIASAQDIERIALDDEADVPALKGWRRKLFGDGALDLKNGRAALSISGDDVVLQPLQAVAAE